MRVLNLTQHQATPDQVEAGVVEPRPVHKDRIRQLLTYEEPPSRGLIQYRNQQLLAIALLYRDGRERIEAAMIGGPPWAMSDLERRLVGARIAPVYAFSRREVVEEELPDGSVRKVAVFRHLGFVEPGHRH